MISFLPMCCREKFVSKYMKNLRSLRPIKTDYWQIVNRVMLQMFKYYLSFDHDAVKLFSFRNIIRISDGSYFV